MLIPLPPAIEEHGYGLDYLDATAQRSGGTPDCLTALGRTLPCTAAEVTSAYRQLARTAYPDRGGTHEAFLTLPGHYEAALQLLNQATGDAYTGPSEGRLYRLLMRAATVPMLGGLISGLVGRAVRVPQGVILRPSVNRWPFLWCHS